MLSCQDIFTYESALPMYIYFTLNLKNSTNMTLTGFKDVKKLTLGSVKGECSPVSKIAVHLNTECSDTDRHPNAARRFAFLSHANNQHSLEK